MSAVLRSKTASGRRNKRKPDVMDAAALWQQQRRDELRRLREERELRELQTRLAMMPEIRGELFPVERARLRRNLETHAPFATRFPDSNAARVVEKISEVLKIDREARTRRKVWNWLGTTASLSPRILAAHAGIPVKQAREAIADFKRETARMEREAARHRATCFDTPKLTPYARALVNSIGMTPERVENVIAAARHFTARPRTGLVRLEDEDLFTAAYHYGSQLAAGNPRRPLDRSGITRHRHEDF